MTAIIHGVHHGDVVLEENEQVGQIPLPLIARARRLAVNNDFGRALINGRAWSRDALILADNTAQQFGLVELPDCTFDADGRECDQPALTTDLHDRPVCYLHAPDDDKDR